MQTRYGTHLAPCTVGSGAPSLVKALERDVNRSPPFRVFVKTEWSFTFDSSICLCDIDKDLTSLQLHVLGLVVVFNVIDIRLSSLFYWWVMDVSLDK